MAQTSCQGFVRAFKAEGKRHMGRVAALGCCVCRNLDLGETPANAHHINCHAMGRRAEDDETIALCPIHHQYGDGTAKYAGHIAVHRSLEEFERRYGTERELLAQTWGEIGYNPDEDINNAIREEIGL